MKEKININAPYCALINGEKELETIIKELEKGEIDIDFITKQININERQLGIMEKELKELGLSYTVTLYLVVVLIAFAVGYSISDQNKRDMIINTIIGKISHGTQVGLELASTFPLIIPIGGYILKKIRKRDIIEKKEEIRELKLIKESLRQINQELPTEKNYETQFIDCLEQEINMDPIVKINQDIINKNALIQENSKPKKNLLQKKLIKK